MHRLGVALLGAGDATQPGQDAGQRPMWQNLQKIPLLLLSLSQVGKGGAVDGGESERRGNGKEGDVSGQPARQRLRPLEGSDRSRSQWASPAWQWGCGGWLVLAQALRRVCL